MARHAVAGRAALHGDERHHLRADSVPAIFALSREPLIVYMSNVFAVLGLRAMYFLLADAIRRFDLLSYALALILIFVGLKMTWLNDLFGGKFDRMVARHHRCPACRRCRGITGERRAPRMRRRSGAAHESAQASQLAHRQAGRAHDSLPDTIVWQFVGGADETASASQLVRGGVHDYRLDTSATTSASPRRSKPRPDDRRPVRSTYGSPNEQA